MRWKSVLAFFILLLLLSSCGEKGVHKKISRHLQASFTAEESFMEHQQALLELEEQDLDVYEQVVQLDDTDETELTPLFQQLFQLIEKRTEHLQEERASIEQSKKKFLSIEPYIERLTDESMKEQVEKMYDTMLERYDVYDDVYETYYESLQLTESFYEHLESNHSSELTQERLEEVNESYEQLFTLNEKFNRLTKRYNRYKKEYYASIREE